jgi:hypothetical protein
VAYTRRCKDGPILTCPWTIVAVTAVGDLWLPYIHGRLSNTLYCFNYPQPWLSFLPSATANWRKRALHRRSCLPFLLFSSSASSLAS